MYYKNRQTEMEPLVIKGWERHLLGWMFLFAFFTSWLPEVWWSIKELASEMRMMLGESSTWSDELFKTSVVVLVRILVRVVSLFFLLSGMFTVLRCKSSRFMFDVCDEWDRYMDEYDSLCSYTESLVILLSEEEKGYWTIPPLSEEEKRLRLKIVLVIKAFIRLLKILFEPLTCTPSTAHVHSLAFGTYGAQVFMRSIPRTSVRC